MIPKELPVPNNDPPQSTMDSKAARSPELVEAEADVERARERVALSVMALRNEMVRRTDWREWIRRRPGTFLAAAFALGFLWGHRRGAGGENRKNNRRSWSWK
jgi:hypothetical protein